MPWFHRNGRKRGSGALALNSVGSALVLCAIGILVPGPRDVIIAALNKYAGLGMSLDTPWWMACALLLLGALAFVPEFAIRLREAGKSPEPTRPFVAVRHQSLDMSVPPRLDEASIPKWLGPRHIEHAECDQAHCLALGALRLTDALDIQRQAFDVVAARRRSDEKLAVGYYGIAHVPLQILAGHTVTTTVRAALFELDRAQSQWRELEQGHGRDLGVVIREAHAQSEPRTAVVRVAVSYDVPLEDVRQIVQDPFDDYLVTVAKPERDVITHYQHVEAIADTFRDALERDLIGPIR